MSLRTMLLILFLLPLGSTAYASGGPRAHIEAVLDAFHQAASDANAERYFALMAKDAVFIGTDATEYWSKAAFQRFAAPYFDKGKGWTYVPTQRQVQLAVDGNTAWFHELLDNSSYGQCRGTGVMVLTQQGWRIAQYHLTIPMPNGLAKSLVKQIQAFEASQQEP